MKFKNQVVVVTGASRGIGQAICVAFAKEGATVVGVARSDLAETGTAVQAAGGTFIPHNADLGTGTQKESAAVIGQILAKAGKLDVPGEPPIECAKRELAEEVGRAAGTWERLGGFYTAPAILEEYIHCFLATDLTAIDHEPIPDEEITVVPWPLADLDALIAQVHDAKSLVGLMRLARGICVS